MNLIEYILLISFHFNDKILVWL